MEKDMGEDLTATGAAPRGHWTGRGRRRTVEREQRIITAARDLFIAQGVQDTTIDEVARRAGVSRQTVYSYFDSKEVLFAAAAREVRGDVLDSTGTQTQILAADDLLTSLVGLAETIVRRVMSPDASALRRHLLAAADPQHLEPWQNDGLQGMRAALARELGARPELALSEQEAATAATLFLDLVTHRPVMDSLLHHPCPDDVIEHYHLTDASWIFLHGIQPADPQAPLDR